MSCRSGPRTRGSLTRLMDQDRPISQRSQVHFAKVPASSSSSEHLSPPASDEFARVTSVRCWRGKVTKPRGRPSDAVAPFRRDRASSQPSSHSWTFSADRWRPFVGPSHSSRTIPATAVRCLADLESVLGLHPHEFESRILRSPEHHEREAGPFRDRPTVVSVVALVQLRDASRFASSDTGRQQHASTHVARRSVYGRPLPPGSSRLPPSERSAVSTSSL